MKTRSFFHLVWHCPMPCLTAEVLVMVLTMAWTSPVLCDTIHDAALVGDLARVRALLKDNPDLVFSKDNEYDWTPLHFATQKGHKDVAELLLANKADVNAKSSGGETPLHVAALDGQKELAELLLANKADVNARTISEQTPLHFAAFNGQKELAELLLANKANVNAKGSDKVTPLHVAVLQGNDDLAEMLRQHGGHE